MNSKEMNSETISTQEILEEIAPLLKEFFVATCRKSGDCIEMRFLNGQMFRILVTA